MYLRDNLEVVLEDRATARKVEVDPRSLAGMIAFFASKPADATYEWHKVGGCGCALVQWKNHCGAEDEAYPDLIGAWGRSSPLDVEGRIAYPRPHTFGAALERARAFLAGLS